jgi:hypothetical protein
VILAGARTVAGVTTMPTWAVWVLAFGTLVLGPAVAGVAAWFSRQAARNVDVAARRTEHGLNFRWAVGQITSHDEKKRLAGVATLTAMLHSNLLEDEEKAVLTSVGGVLLDPLLPKPQERHGVLPTDRPTRSDVELAGLLRLVAVGAGAPVDPGIAAVADSDPPEGGEP